MAAFIFDASAIVKRDMNETGSRWVQALADVSDETASFFNGPIVG